MVPMKWAERVVWGHIQVWMMWQVFEVLVVLMGPGAYDSSGGEGGVGVRGGGGIGNGRVKKQFQKPVITSL